MLKSWKPEVKRHLKHPGNTCQSISRYYAPNGFLINYFGISSAHFAVMHEGPDAMSKYDMGPIFKLSPLM